MNEGRNERLLDALRETLMVARAKWMAAKSEHSKAKHAATRAENDYLNAYERITTYLGGMVETMKAECNGKGVRP